MPEHEKDNDSLSRFFQKAAQKPQIKFEKGDWEKLEAFLDAVQSKTISDSPFQWRTIVASVIAILFLSVSTYIFSSYNTGNTVNDTKDGKSNRMVADSTHEMLLDSKLSSQAQSSRAAVSIDRHNSPGDSMNKLSKGIRIPVTSQRMVTSSLMITGQKSIISERSSDLLKGDESYTRENIIQTVRSQYSSAEGLSSTNDEVTLNLATNDSMLRYSLADVIANLSLPTDSIQILTANNSVELSRADSLSDMHESTYASRWSILLTLSPDFSSTGLRRFTSPGEAWGMLVYYRLNNALSISAGTIKSNKIYQDYGSNYKPNNESFWTKNTNGVTPSEIRGACSVLEIPLGLQYNIWHVKRSDVYVAVGFSSYVMLKESYHYMFSAPNPGATEGWNANKTTYYPFSIANFSVGYERSISRQITIGISSYIKVPITGIGAWANVKLYSMGAAFTVRYNLQKKNRGIPFYPDVGGYGLTTLHN